MKKVWVLEKFVTIDERERHLHELKAMALNNDLTEDQKELAWKMVQAEQKRIEDFPQGEWVGWEGKSNYRQFCEVAQDCLRRYKGRNDQFRVVSAEVEDGAKYWTGYVNPVENKGVLRYLYVTL